MGSLVHTGLGSSSLVAHVLPYPLPSHANSFVLGPAVINTHTVLQYKHKHLSPPPRSLVRDGQTSPHRPRLVVSRSTCPPLSLSPPREQLLFRYCSNNNKHTGTAVINTHTPASPPSSTAQLAVDKRDLESELLHISQDSNTMQIPVVET